MRLERLKHVRLRAAVSQGELAAASGVHRATINRLEAGARGAQPKTARRLARALGVEPEELLRGREGEEAGDEHR